MSQRKVLHITQKLEIRFELSYMLSFLSLSDPNDWTVSDESEPRLESHFQSKYKDEDKGFTENND